VNLVPQKITTDATWRSDHGSFWSQGYAGILSIEDFDDFNPHYHSTNDTLANMQAQMMLEYTKASVATLAELASRLYVSPPTPTPTYTPTPTPTYTPTPTPTYTPTPTPTYTPTPRRIYVPVVRKAQM
jgi:hypothetical protein